MRRSYDASYDNYIDALAGVLGRQIADLERNARSRTSGTRAAPSQSQPTRSSPSGAARRTGGSPSRTPTREQPQPSSVTRTPMHIDTAEWNAMGPEERAALERDYFVTTGDRGSKTGGKRDQRSASSRTGSNSVLTEDEIKARRRMGNTGNDFPGADEDVSSKGSS